MSDNQLSLFATPTQKTGTEQDSPHPALPSGAKENSFRSFISEDVQLKRGTQQWQVYDCLKTHGPNTQRKIAQITGIDRFLIPDRLQKLQRKGLVVECGSTFDITTNKTVTLYRVIR